MDSQIPFDKLDIFTVLGVDQDDPDKESFLRKMEDALWEEIIESEVGDKLEVSEITTLESILHDENISTTEKRDKLFGFLAEKIPHFELIVREYTLSAKKDLLLERLEALKEFYAQDMDALFQVNQADILFDEGKFSECVMLLNELPLVSLETQQSVAI